MTVPAQRGVGAGVQAPHPGHPGGAHPHLTQVTGPLKPDGLLGPRLEEKTWTPRSTAGCRSGNTDSKWIMGLNVKPKTIKLAQEKPGEVFVIF